MSIPEPESRFEGAAGPPLLEATRSSLFLDFDGTFVDFAPTPEAVRLRAGSKELLGLLAGQLGGALAIVSGRRIADIDGFLAPLVLTAAGVHGQEMRAASGETRVLAPSPDLDIARRRLAAALPSGDPLHCEDKGGALVLHYRQHPEQNDRAARLAAAAVAGLADIYALEGHAMVEIRQHGVSKGAALQVLNSTPPFAGRIPVFVGDDTTDEDGFAAAAAAGGFGVKVGPGPTGARYRLADVGAVHEWLARCVAIAGAATGLPPPVRSR